MGVWIELQCDQRQDGVRAGTYDPRCASHRNDTPGALSHHSQAAVNATLANLAEEARKRGWKRVGQAWVCAGCLAP